MRRNKQQLNCSSPKNIVSYFAPLMENLPREELRILFLDKKNRLIRDQVISRGSLSSTVVDPRDIFREAVKANSAAIVLLHNHPSGDPEPSRDDLQTTKRIAQAGYMLGIKLHDHLIIGKERFISMASHEDYRYVFDL